MFQRFVFAYLKLEVCFSIFKKHTIIGTISPQFMNKYHSRRIIGKSIVSLTHTPVKVGNSNAKWELNVFQSPGQPVDVSEYINAPGVAFVKPL